MKSIRWKLVFMYLTLVFIVMLVSGTFIILSFESQETGKAEEELRQCALYIKEQIIDQYEAPEEFQKGFENVSFIMSSERNMRGNILDSEGNTIASSIATDTDSFLEYKNSSVISALAGKESFAASKKDIDQNSQVKEWMNYAYPVFGAENNVEYVVFVQMDAESINQSIANTTKTILVAVLLALVLTGILGLAFANTITEPIAVLTKKANMLAKGKLEQHAVVKSNDEIGQLTRSFNTMARELRKTVSEMENENNKLEIVLHNMTDGVLAFDERGILIHANKVCYDMLDIDDIRISFKWLLDKLNISKDEIEPESVTEVTINENDKYISVALIPYSTNRNKVNGTVVVLHDITKHRQLDDMRKEFVANVSHEIGTPLTTIKGYTELLLDGVVEDKDEMMGFLKEINVAVDRMKLLRDDLLDLSRFDTKVNKFSKHRVDLVKLVEGCVRQNIIVAATKKQTIEFNPPDHNMWIMADAPRINQVITNIMSNAMKYSGDGTKINITIREGSALYYVDIKDKGIGMPKEALGRIFDRFYRVDKARSRAMGGNGLGLAIAKEIMEAHFGNIEVYSEVGVGTTMILIFPKYDGKRQEDFSDFSDFEDGLQ